MLMLLLFAGPVSCVGHHISPHWLKKAQEGSTSYENLQRLNFRARLLYTFADEQQKSFKLETKLAWFMQGPGLYLLLHYVASGRG